MQGEDIPFGFHDLPDLGPLEARVRTLEEITGLSVTALLLAVQGQASDDVIKALHEYLRENNVQYGKIERLGK